MEQTSDRLNHHCGVMGIYQQQTDVPQKLFYSLFALQHRGQESAGICYRKDRELVVYKDLGMVSTVLSRYLDESRKSKLGIGHVRYSTQGGNRIENAQPMLVTCNKGNIALAHNGNISNSNRLRRTMVAEGSIFQSTADTELVLHMLARSKQKCFDEALQETLGKLQGAFSMVLLHENTLYAVRDSMGFRPLYMGTFEDGFAFASETCALDMLGISKYRSLEAGEIIKVDENGAESRFLNKKPQMHQCIFELIYFARPDSMVFDEWVHDVRVAIGGAMARAETVEADIVVPVPDSGNHAALGFARESGIPLEMGLTRNHYTGRSFILPTTTQRELAVKMKLHPVRSAVNGRRVILVDDSLVRGTTSKIIVSLLRKAGAREIHIRLSSPEIKWPCYYGIDTPTRKELISNTLTPEALAEHLGADSVRFLALEDLRQCVSHPYNYCYACFDGDYPVQIED